MYFLRIIIFARNLGITQRANLFFHITLCLQVGLSSIVRNHIAQNCSTITYRSRKQKSFQDTTMSCGVSRIVSLLYTIILANFRTGNFDIDKFEIEMFSVDRYREML